MPALFSEKFYLLSSNFLGQALRVGTMFVMARKVAPEDYGAYTLLLSGPGLLTALGDLNISQSYVQLRDVPEERLFDTALVMTLGIHACYAAAIVGFGCWLAWARQDARLWHVAIAAGLTVVLVALYQMQLARLNRRLSFVAESRQNIVFAIAQAGTGASLALAGWGIYALALQALAGQLIANVVAFWRAPLKVPTGFSRDAARQLVALGGKVSLASYCWHAQVNVVNLVIHHVAGAAVLGAWGRAVQVQQLFAQNLMASFDRVTYPILCHARDDLPRVRDMLPRIAVTMSVVACFGGAMMFALAEEITRVVLGPNWPMVPPLLRILAIATPAGAAYSVGHVAGFSLGRTGWVLRAAVIDLVLFMPVLYVAQRLWGVQGIAAAWVLSRFVIATAMLWPVVRAIRPPLAVPALKVAGIVACAALAAGAMLWLTPRLASISPSTLLGVDKRLDPPVQLAAAATCGVGVYLLAIAVSQRGLVRDILRLVRPPRQPAP